jgi:putative FmdB family regulatory protein
MPLFEYQCRDCGRVFEVFTRRRDQKVSPKCPECGKTDVERIWSSFSGRAGEGGGCATSPLGFG